MFDQTVTSGGEGGGDGVTVCQYLCDANQYFQADLWTSSAMCVLTETGTYRQKT